MGLANSCFLTKKPFFGWNQHKQSHVPQEFKEVNENVQLLHTAKVQQLKSRDMMRAARFYQSIQAEYMEAIANLRLFQSFESKLYQHWSSIHVHQLWFIMAKTALFQVRAFLLKVQWQLTKIEWFVVCYDSTILDLLFSDWDAVVVYVHLFCRELEKIQTHAHQFCLFAEV